jgi:molybdopterin-guanine dinucleotide biosynthesis protein A
MVSLAILSGGKSERMGTSKALLPFLGKPLIQRIVERLSALSDDILITTDQPNLYKFLQLPLFEDLWPGLGSLGGLFTSLTVAKNPYLAAVGCDMPFASLELFEYECDRLIQTGVDVVIPSTSKGLEPLHAVYRRDTCLPAIRSALEAGNLKLVSWLPDVKAEIISVNKTKEFDPQNLVFWNVNTPEEFQRAEERAEQDDGI